MKIRIRDLDERIRIIYYLTARNKYGDLIKVREVTRCRVWARVHPLAQKIDDDTPERLNKTTYRITIRWREDIQPNDEIVWRDRYFKIISTPTEFEVRRQYKVFDAQEIQKDFVLFDDSNVGIAVFDSNKNLINSKVRFATDEEFSAMLDDVGNSTVRADYDADMYEWTIAMFDTDGNLVDSGIKFASVNDVSAMLDDVGLTED